MAQAVTITNYSDEDFTHKWDSVDYTFPAGKSTMMEASLALHFAKHLAVRELNKRNVPSLGRNVIGEEMKKAINAEESVEAEDTTKLAQVTLNANADKEKEEKKAPKKEEKKELPEDLDEFEGKDE